MATTVSTGWLLVPLLGAVVACDLRLMRIPNWLVVLFLVVFVVAVPVQIGLAETGWRLVAAATVFAIGLALFVLRVLGGGDVKLLTVLVLFVPGAHLAIFALLLSGAMILSLAGLALLRRVRAGRPSRWRGLVDARRFPLGLAIGLASVGLMAVQTA